MICARDVSCPNIIPEGVIELEQFITNPRAIKRQLPLKPRILSASSDFDGPCMLRRQRRVNHAGIRTLSKVAKIVRIKHLDPFPKARRKESAVLEIAMEPERTDVNLNLISSNG